MPTNDTTKTPAQSVRERLKQRRTDSRERVIKIPFIADVDLAKDAERLSTEHDRLIDDIALLEAQRDERDADETADVDTRADGRDRSDLGAEIDASRARLALVEEQLAETVQAVREGAVTIEFRVATKGEYERILIEVENEVKGEVGVDQSPTILFGDRLMAGGFVRVHKDGENLGYATWDEFAEDMELSFGDVDPIRTVVYTKNRQTGAFALPF